MVPLACLSPKRHGEAMRGFGYLISMVSVLLLGMIAWPKPDDPAWHGPALLFGMALSIAGMGLRWTASHRQERAIREVRQKAGLGSD